MEEPKNTQNELLEDGETIAWEVKIPLLTNRFMLWSQLKSLTPLVVLIFLGLLLFWSTKSNVGYTRDPGLWTPTLVLTGISVVVLFLLVSICDLLFFLNRFWRIYRMDPTGVGFEYSKGTASIIRLTSMASMAGGAASGNTGHIAGGLMQAGYMAKAVPWHKIKKCTIFRNHRVVTLSNSWRPVMRLFFPNTDVFKQALEKLHKFYDGKPVVRG